MVMIGGPLWRVGKLFELVGPQLVLKLGGFSGLEQMDGVF